MTSTIRTTTAALALAIAGSAMCGAASAQSQPGTAPGAATGAATADPAQMRELDDDRTDVTWNGLTLDEIEDMDVIDATGRTIGEVEDILGDAQDKVVGFVVEAGGFLGIGDEEVVVTADRARLDPERNALVVDMSEEELKNLQRWDD